MRLFRSAADDNHHWTVGQNHDPKFLITPENKSILSLRRPTNLTYWQITPYLFPTSYSSEGDEENEECEEDGGDDDEEGPQNIPPTGGASPSHHARHPSYHQQYMHQFQSIHPRLDTY